MEQRLASLSCSSGRRRPWPADGPAGRPASDLAAARAVFEKNLQAIRDQDRDGYLACYLESERLVRTGPGGVRPRLCRTRRRSRRHRRRGLARPHRRRGPPPDPDPSRRGLRHLPLPRALRQEEVSGISERLFIATPKGWKIAVSTAFAALPGVPPPPRALVGATLVDGTGAAPVPDAVVILRDGKIDCAGPRSTCPVPPGVDTLDLLGQWITPGLIDAHVHFSQTGWADGRPDSSTSATGIPTRRSWPTCARHPERFGRTQLCSGVTAVFDVGGYPVDHPAARALEPASDLPRVAAAGPLLSTLDLWLNLPGEKQFIYLSDARAARPERAISPPRERTRSRSGSSAPKGEACRTWPPPSAPPERRRDARAAADRARHQPDRGQGGAPRRGEAARPQRLGPVGRPGVPRPRPRRRHDLLPDPDGRRRLPAALQGDRRAPGSRRSTTPTAASIPEPAPRWPRPAASPPSPRTGSTRSWSARARPATPSATGSPPTTCKVSWRPASRSQWARTPATR